MSDDVFLAAEYQRCWNHRVLNVLAKLSKRPQSDARHRLEPAAALRNRLA